MRYLHWACLICAVSMSLGVVAARGQNPQPTPDKKEMMDMDNTVMAMSHHHDDMGPHMKMTMPRPARPGDAQRADAVVKTAREVLQKYQDYRAALADGFEIFMPNLPQPMYHFTNYRFALEAEFRFNPERPTSLLYEKQGDGYKLLGAMYTAAAGRSEDELDQLIPLSVAQWHQHVNFCFPPDDRRAEMLAPGSRFGMAGSISTKEGCDQVGGKFLPRLFGWMVHVYPFEQTAEKIWSVDRQMHNAMEMGTTRTSRGSGGVAAQASDPNVKQSTTTFKSDNKDISVEVFEPVKAGKYPGVVLLYGAGGMSVGGLAFQQAALALARQGYVVYLPHYFDKTGTQVASHDDDTKYFAAWMKTVADTIDLEAKQPNVDPERIGLIGYSLGAYLSLSLATVDHQVKAVVEYFGGLPDFFVNQLKTMPPTLILHGDADPVVSVQEAYKLEKLLKSKGLPYEIHIYPHEGHGFNGSAGADSMQQTIAFFGKHLKK